MDSEQDNTPVETLTDAITEAVRERVELGTFEDRRGDSDDSLDVLLVDSTPLHYREAVYDHADRVDCYVASDPSDLVFRMVESSNLEAIGYDNVLEVAYVQFQETDGTYLYFDVPREVYEGLVEAESHGSFFHSEIKGEYACINV